MQILNKLLSTSTLIIISLLVSEACLRLYGVKPRPQVINDNRAAINTAPSKVLGWQPQTGVFDIQPILAPTKKFRVTNWTRLGRATRPNMKYEDSCKLELVLLGGSMVQGFGLDDPDTLGWQLQELLPNMKVENSAVGGYGGYQSLLMLKEVQKQPKLCSRMFIYALASFHEKRNVGEPYTLIKWNRNSITGNIRVPVVEYTSSKITEQIRYISMPTLPLRGYFAFVSIIEDLIFWSRGIPTPDQQKELSFHILEEMKKTIEAEGDQLLIFLLDFNSEKVTPYISYLQEKQIQFINGYSKELNQTDFQLGYDTHPNRAMIEIWAKLIANYLES